MLIYTIKNCPYCINAKRLLDGKDVRYEEIDVSSDPNTRRQASDKFDWRTVPIILINDKLIGGYDELRKLERENKLDGMLG